MPYDLAKLCRDYPSHPLCQPSSGTSTPRSDPEAPTAPRTVGTEGGEHSNETGESASAPDEPSASIRERLEEWARDSDLFLRERALDLRRLTEEAGYADITAAINRVLGE